MRRKTWDAFPCRMKKRKIAFLFIFLFFTAFPNILIKYIGCFFIYTLLLTQLHIYISQTAFSKTNWSKNELVMTCCRHFFNTTLGHELSAKPTSMFITFSSLPSIFLSKTEIHITYQTEEVLDVFLHRGNTRSHSKLVKGIGHAF